MAGSSMNDIKARIKSVQSTMQITKAMELVATSKLRRAKEKAESSRKYHELLAAAISDVEATSEAGLSLWAKKDADKKALIIVVAGDRGLAGGFNSNIFKIADTLDAKQDSAFITIGKKAVEHFERKGAEIFDSSYPEAADFGVGDAVRLGKKVADAFSSGEFGSVILVYTKFVSMLTQLPLYEELLPLSKEADAKERDAMYDEDPEELLARIVPEYVGGVLHSAVCEALASESAARRTAMNAANKNASEMIDSLMLRYNRARQAVITQEITEIVSGSEAL
jgi:F-type H+-transporting ATPase subunit gamma